MMSGGLLLILLPSDVVPVQYRTMVPVFATRGTGEKKVDRSSAQ